MLVLPIKKKWFDMIISGEKKEEYREIKPYYDIRFKKYMPRSNNFRYDAKDGKGQYLKDIKELDKVMDKLKKKEYITDETEELKVDNSEIVITKKEYKKLIAKQYYLLGKLHGEKTIKNRVDNIIKF